MKKKIESLIESATFQWFIIAVILINAIALGVQTFRTLGIEIQHAMEWVDRICLIIFIIEILLKLFVHHLGFFKDGWNLFDFSIVAIALLPTQGGLSVLRAFRIFRIMRLISVMPAMRHVVSGMLLAIPGVGSVGGLLLVVFYIGAVLTTTLFGEQFPEWFGDLWRSMYTLFQIMTLESWSMGIVRPVMDAYPLSWLFFLPFIIITTFTVLNLFIGIIVEAMALAKEEERARKEGRRRKEVEEHFQELNDRLDRLERLLIKHQGLKYK